MGALIRNFPVITSYTSVEDEFEQCSNSGYYGKVSTTDTNYFNKAVINNLYGTDIIGMRFNNPEVFRPYYSDTAARLYNGCLFLSSNPINIHLLFKVTNNDSTPESPRYYFYEYTDRTIVINGLNYYGFADISGGMAGIWAGFQSGIYSVATFDTLTEAVQASGVTPIRDKYPINYRLTNATSNGPSEAAVGDTVNVDLTFSTGYGIVNPSSDVYVTNNGVIVSSTYANGRLTFTMPDPS